MLTSLSSLLSTFSREEEKKSVLKGKWFLLSLHNTMVQRTTQCHIKVPLNTQTLRDEYKHYNKYASQSRQDSDRQLDMTGKIVWNY